MRVALAKSQHFVQRVGLILYYYSTQNPFATKMLYFKPYFMRWLTVAIPVEVSSVKAHACPEVL